MSHNELVEEVRKQLYHLHYDEQEMAEHLVRLIKRYVEPAIRADERRVCLEIVEKIQPHYFGIELIKVDDVRKALGDDDE